MEEYLTIGATVLAILAFIPAIIFFFRSIKHFLLMLNHFKSGRHNTLANFIPFLAPFFSQFFTEEGNIHRSGFINNMALFLCCFAFIAIVFNLLGIKS